MCITQHIPSHSSSTRSTASSAGRSSPPGQKGKLLVLPWIPLLGSGSRSIDMLLTAAPPGIALVSYMVHIQLEYQWCIKLAIFITTRLINNRENHTKPYTYIHRYTHTSTHKHTQTYASVNNSTKNTPMLKYINSLTQTENINRCAQTFGHTQLQAIMKDNIAAIPLCPCTPKRINAHTPTYFSKSY